ncbi:hypothetical protein PAXRUDRAFT_376708 [Paxillus rubicundulus Ve08.2h10]|uniref:Uncharacterized protein n=1 Tax=Paxillus rubicundulus Ve08.2h10 TaxID=930991 RepID=A0A0D0E3N7_9AGAM|nr:hypothetical protein PAXRUDRAFT_376708 [Paxillus rubicundulus Ve08.2h10]
MTKGTCSAFACVSAVVLGCLYITSAVCVGRVLVRDPCAPCLQLSRNAFRDAPRSGHTHFRESPSITFVLNYLSPLFYLYFVVLGERSSSYPEIWTRVGHPAGETRCR